MGTFIRGPRLGVHCSHAFVFKIQRSPSPPCQDCGDVENAQNVVLNYSRHKARRRKLQLQIYQLDNRPMSFQKIIGTEPCQNTNVEPLRVVYFSFERGKRGNCSNLLICTHHLLSFLFVFVCFLQALEEPAPLTVASNLTPCFAVIVQ